MVGKRTFTLLMTFGALPFFTVAEERFKSLSVDITPFVQNGCSWIEARHEGKEPCCVEIPAHFECPQPEFKAFGCSRIEKVPDYYGGLYPKVGIVECIFHGPENAPATDGIRYVGAGWLPVYNKFIVYTGSGFKLLNNEIDFWEFFCPVESPEEALSFAAALTGAYPLYAIDIPKGYVKEVPDIRSTFVEETPDGFKVHLFNYQLGGCGPHHHFSIDYLVTRHGSVREIARQNVWRDPKEDDLCVD